MNSNLSVSPRPSVSGHPLTMPPGAVARAGAGDRPAATVTRLGPSRVEPLLLGADMVRTQTEEGGWPGPVRLAPLCRAVQRGLGRAEAALAGEAPPMPPAPVFVTGLPGGGASVAFGLLAGGGHYAAFRDGDGAFVAAPKAARAARWLARRAAGAPAPLDEVLWVAAGGRAAGHRAGAARLCAEEGGKRYLGKNAGLMGRLPALRAAYPDARVVVAFREPLAQVAAMPEDERTSRADWLRYWVDAHRRAMAEPGAVFLNADRLETEGRPMARRLAQATDTPESEAYLDGAPGGSAGHRQSGMRRFTVPAPLLAEARALHWRLAREAI